MAAWAPAAVAGAALRTWHLGDQVFLDDEFHAVRAALALEPAAILTTFGRSDYCLPLTALAGWLSQLGLPMSEISMRAPSAIAGVALLLVAPAFVARLLGVVPATVFVWLAASSAPLVLYSRIARSYAPALLLAFAAVGAFAIGWLERRRRWLALWALLTAVATWVLMLSAGFAAAPWLVAAVAVALDRPAGSRRRWRELAAAGTGCALLVAAWLVPALGSFWTQVDSKRGRGALSVGLVREAPGLLAGLAPPAAVALWVVAAVAGWWFARRAGWPALLLAAPALAQLVMILMLRPEGLGNPVIAARYLQPMVPILLLGVALAVVHLLRLEGRGLLRAQAAGALLALGLLVAGPLPALLETPASFAASFAAMRFTRPLDSWAPDRLPRAYRTAVVRRAETLVEAPYLARSTMSLTVQTRWLAHRKRVILATPELAAERGRTRFGTLVRLAPEPILDSAGDALVVHRRLPSEERAAVAAVLGRRHLAEERKQLGALARFPAVTIRQLRRSWGPPDYQDRNHAVWDLRRVRQGRSR